MARVVIVGTIGLDNVTTPFGSMQNILGGSATFAAYASSFFAKTGIVSIVGEDFPEEYSKILTDRGICLNGLVKKGKTFRWHGSYEGDMNEAKTLNTELNSLLDFNAELPEDGCRPDVPPVFLGWRAFLAYPRLDESRPLGRLHGLHLLEFLRKRI